jgi:hypothetical protein
MDFKHEDVLRALEAESTWNKAAFACSKCRYKDVESSCETPKGRICVSCAGILLRDTNQKIDLSNWSFTKFKEALLPNGRLRWRLLALARFDEILSKISTDHELNQLLALLVDNLGFLNLHPLARTVRQQALNACVRAGVVILPVLLEKAKPNPWELYSNIIAAATSINSEDPGVQKLLTDAVSHPNPGVREKMIFALASAPATFAQSLLTQLANDQNFHVRTMARQKIAEHNRVVKQQKPANIYPRVTNTAVEKKRPGPKINGNDPILMVIEGEYLVNDLRKFYQAFLVEFVPLEKLGLPNEPNSFSKLRKADLAFALKQVLDSKEMSLALFERFPESARKVLSALVWLGGFMDVAETEKHFNIEIFEKDSRADFPVQPAYLICSHRSYYEYRDHYKHSLFLPERFRTILRNHLPFPEFSKLKPIDGNPAAEFLRVNNIQIVEQVYDLFRYLKTGNIQFSRNGNKIMAASIKDIQRHFQIQDFFVDQGKDLDDLKLHLLIFFLQEYKYKSAGEGLQFYKQMFTSFFNGDEQHGFYVSSLLDHIKSSRDSIATLDNENRFRKSLLELLKSLPVGQWIGFPNAIANFLCRDLFYLLVTTDFAYNFLSFKYRQADSTRSSNYNRMNITRENYNSAILEPILKSSFFLVGALGLLDLAYDLPWKGMPQNRFITSYDGLRAIRLTDLGAYVLGLKPELAESIVKHEAKVTLDEKHLILYLEGEDPVKSMMLEKIGEPLNPTCFKVTFQSFLKGCSSQEEIQNRLKFFNQYVSKKPPENWKKFIDTVSKKMNPLSAETTFAVFKIEPERELVELISRDEVLRKCVIKAENFRILIETQNLKKVKKRLEEFGYFIDNW